MPTTGSYHWTRRRTRRPNAVRTPFLPPRTSQPRDARPDAPRRSPPPPPFSARLPILNNDLVRLRITAARFQEHEPGPPRDRIKVVDGVAVPIAEDEDEMLPGYLLEVRLRAQARARPPPRPSPQRPLTDAPTPLHPSQATIAEQGLGVTAWWPAGEEEDDDTAPVDETTDVGS